jgi:uncharacterized protein
MIVNNRYIDIDINFSRNSFNNDVSKVIDENSIKQSLLSILLTSKKEKPFNSDFGIGLYDYLFSNLDSDDIGTLASEIETQLKKYEPRVLFEEIEVEQQDFTFDIKISYFVSTPNSGQPVLQTVKLSLAKVR